MGAVQPQRQADHDALRVVSAGDQGKTGRERGLGLRRNGGQRLGDRTAGVAQRETDPFRPGVDRERSHYGEGFGDGEGAAVPAVVGAGAPDWTM